jgi:beta-glucosidase/6-phospho-beta-glucosidase/beta-galactosidase
MLFRLLSLLPDSAAECATNMELTNQLVLLCRTLGPLVFGDYPQAMKTNVGSRLPSFTKSQSEFVKGAIDFIGINHYYSVYVNDRPLKEGVRDYAADMSVYQRGKQILYLHRHIAALFISSVGI